MCLDDSQIEVVDDDNARMLRDMTGAQRLQVAEKMFRFMRQFVAGKLREQHSDWTPAQIEAETSWKILADEIDRAAIDACARKPAIVEVWRTIVRPDDHLT